VLAGMMESVEDIPRQAILSGLPWNWETFPEYLDALDARQFDIDIAAQLPHSALRVYVMGERGANREPATREDIARMAVIAKGAVEAGALGFSTSRTLNHRTSDGQPTPTLTAGEDELEGIALGLKAAGKGVLQFVLRDESTGATAAEFSFDQLAFDPRASAYVIAGGDLRNLVGDTSRPATDKTIRGALKPYLDALLAQGRLAEDGDALPFTLSATLVADGLRVPVVGSLPLTATRRGKTTVVEPDAVSSAP
jgi:hypothetical protein